MNKAKLNIRTRDICTAVLPILLSLAFMACDGVADSTEPPLTKVFSPHLDGLCDPIINADPQRSPGSNVLVLGPLLLHRDHDHATIYWKSHHTCPGVVQWGFLPGDATNTATDDKPTDQEHWIDIDWSSFQEELRSTSGLRVQYTIIDCGNTALNYSFDPAPAAGRPVRLAFISDSQSAPGTFDALDDLVSLYHPHAIVHGGDAVQYGRDDEFNQYFFDPLKDLWPYTPVYMTLGNHDDGAGPYFGIMKPVQFAGRHGLTSYALTVGNVFLLVIDTIAPLADSMDWIEQQMGSKEAQEATWRIVVGHKPDFMASGDPLDCGTVAGDQEISGLLMPAMKRHGFHLYLAGHAHSYERSELDEIVEIVAGGGGGKLDGDCRTRPETKYVAHRHHFLVIDSGCDYLSVSAYALNDPTVPFDQVVIHKGRLPPPVAATQDDAVERCYRICGEQDRCESACNPAGVCRSDSDCGDREVCDVYGLCHPTLQSCPGVSWEQTSTTTIWAGLQPDGPWQMYLEANNGTVQGRLLMTQRQGQGMEELGFIGKLDLDSGTVDALGSTMPNSGDEVAALAIQNDGQGNMVLTKDGGGEKVVLSQISSCATN